MDQLPCLEQARGVEDRIICTLVYGDTLETTALKGGKSMQSSLQGPAVGRVGNQAEDIPTSIKS